MTKATHYNNTSDGPVVELAFSEDMSDGSVDSSDFDVYVDGELVDGSPSVSEGNGQVVLDLGVSEVQTGDVQVNITGDVTDPAGNAVDTGNRSVTVAPVTVDVGSSNASVYQGTNVAVEFDTRGGSLEITNNDGYSLRPGTGAQSQVYVFNTDDLDLGEYEIDADRDGDVDSTVEVLDLRLDVNVDDTSVTEGNSITGTVEAAEGDRQVTVSIDGDSQTVTVDPSSLSADFSLDPSDTGNYTVTATDVISGQSAESDTVEVTQAAETDAGFGGDKLYEVPQGDIAEIPIELTSASQATVQVGGEDVGYLVNVTVEDTDDDGMVTLEMNTYLAGTGTDAYTAAGDDEVTSQENVDIGDELLETGQYPINVRAGGDASDRDQDRGIVKINDRSTGEMSIWTGPSGSFGDISDASDITSMIEDGSITEADAITQDDLLVHSVEINGIYGAVEANGDLRSTVESTLLDVSVNQTNAEDPGPNQDADPKYISLLAAGNSDDVTFLSDAENETVYIVVDTSTVDVTTEDGDSADLEAGDEFESSFMLNATDTNSLADEDQYANASWSVSEASLSISEDSLYGIAAESGQTISGESSLAPGTSLNVRVSGDTFITGNDSVTVQADGSWSATLDFSEGADGDAFEVEVTPVGETSPDATATGTIGEEAPTTTTTTSDDTTTSTTTSTTESTTTSTTESTTESTTTSTTEETTAGGTTDDGTTDGGTDTTTESSGTPGFTVAIGLVALLAAALLALRKE